MVAGDEVGEKVSTDLVTKYATAAKLLALLYTSGPKRCSRSVPETVVDVNYSLNSLNGVI